MGKSVTRSNLAKANGKRDSRIFEAFAYHLIALAREKRQNSDFAIKGQVYAFDSTTIDLCLNVFWWAKFRKNKGGIKVSTLFDAITQIPAFVHISTANTHDVNAMDMLVYEPEAYYIFDRAYIDFQRLFKVIQHSAFSVVRAKSNLRFSRMYGLKRDKEKDVKCDQISKLTGFYISKYYPQKKRRVKFFDKESEITFMFLTNNFELSAEEIAYLYKNRWQIELFFKWIKQHLKIKSFWGDTENAIRIQIFSAIITYCLVAIVGSSLKIERSTYEILQVLGISLLDKPPVNELFKIKYSQNDKEPICNQLSLSLF